MKKIFAFILVMALTPSLFAGEGYSCYKLATQRLYGYDPDELQSACKRIRNPYALTCVNIVFSKIRMGDFGDLIKSCGKIKSSDSLECVQDSFRRYSMADFSDLISDCGSSW